MRDLARTFNERFDWVISCFALYEIPTDEGIQQAIQGIYNVLTPGGKCYIRFRDMDFLMEEKPRHVYCGEKRLPNGRIICIEDWDYESETHVVALEAFLREDESLKPANHFRWVTERIGCRKKVMRKNELQGYLIGGGFDPEIFLPQPEPWFPVQVVATRRG